MSDQMISVGFMAKLKTPVGNHHADEWGVEQDRLYAVDSALDVQMNYGGDILFWVSKQEESYNFDLLVGLPANKEEFIEKCVQVGVEIDEQTIIPFFANWYNGADSPMSDIEMKDFDERLKSYAGR